MLPVVAAPPSPPVLGAVCGIAPVVVWRDAVPTVGGGVAVADETRAELVAAGVGVIAAASVCAAPPAEPSVDAPMGAAAEADSLREVLSSELAATVRALDRSAMAPSEE